MHRFYLGQVGLGIVYCLLIGTGISFLLGLIDAIAFFVMDKEVFDHKYNRGFIDNRQGDYRDRRRDTDFDRRRYRSREYGRDERYERRTPRYQPDRRAERYDERDRAREVERAQPVPKPNPHKQEGIQKYKDYDYKGAIKEFEKALQVDERDIAVHFNLACAYSLEEKSQKAFYHLDKAVEYGFQDFEKIREHDALAYLRIQPEFDDFEANNYRLSASQGPQASTVTDSSTEDASNLLDSQPDLLDQIKKLGELREQGLLTEEEFEEQKRKLLG